MVYYPSTSPLNPIGGSLIGQVHIQTALAKRVLALQNGVILERKHLAFEAPRGMGKTRIMRHAANMFGLSPIDTAFKRGTQLDKAVNNLRNQWRPGCVWIVDELHNLSIPNQMALKKLAETGTYTMNSGDDIDIPSCVIFSAFTDRSLIDPELLERFTIFRFASYTPSERLSILTTCAESRGIEIPFADAELIAIMNGTPRDLENAIDTASILSSVGEKVCSTSIFNEQGKDADGLDLFNRQALLAIADLLGKNIKATLEIVSDTLRISHKATSMVLSELASMGYVKASPSIGRTLTNEGWRKIDAIRAENSLSE